MKTFKQLMALLLVFVLVAACVPLGTITAFAEENDNTEFSAETLRSMPNRRKAQSLPKPRTKQRRPQTNLPVRSRRKNTPPQKLRRKILPLPNRRKKPLNPFRMRKKRNPIPKTRSWIWPMSLTRRSWISCGNSSRMVKSPWISILWISLTRTPPTAAAPVLKPVTVVVEVMQQAVVPATW